MKNTYALLGAFGVAVLLTIVTPYLSPQEIQAEVSQSFDTQSAIIPQAILETTKLEQTHNVIYEKDRIIGILKDEHKLQQVLDKVYKERYIQNFPDTKIGLGEDIHVSSEMSFFTYEDKDDEILAYLDEHDLFSVETNKIEFGNGEIAYVKHIEDFQLAQNEFALNFVDSTSYTLLKAGKDTPELGDHQYGTRIQSASYKYGASVSKGLAAESKILKNKDEIVKYLSYGYNPETIMYTTKEYDTVEGIAWLNQLTIQHILSINSEKLVSDKQLLKIGTELDVTPLSSPVEFEVVKEEQVEESVAPESTEIIYDDTLREGMEVITVKQEYGKRNVRYEETFVNGARIGKGKEIASVTTLHPIREVKRVGTKIYPEIGSGHFRWPVENAMISCSWYCYYPHPATDVQNRFNFYGAVLASDRGEIITNSYNGYNGYYMEIDHHNGYVTYYGHMSGPGFFPVGTVVAQGEPIGNIGMTGAATGPHVHFEIRQNGVQINPETLVGR